MKAATSPSPGGTVVKYDRTVIQQFAERLYAQARTVIVVWTILGAIGGLIAGAAVADALDSQQTLAFVGVGALLVALVGFKFGQGRAFALRLQAQMALCQTQIEENTGAVAAKVAGRPAA
jgi:hypothetical protein